ncbi:MAG: T9SS type A sorting domain-containing protein [Bacteroidia bacterium]
MKKELLAIALLFGALITKSQTVLSDLENVTTPNWNNEVYNDSLGGNGFNSGDAHFATVWDTSFGGFWSSGWAASAHYDSITAGYTNPYGCIAKKGYGNSNKFAVGTTSMGLNIALSGVSLGNRVQGLYVCNSTWAYLSMRDGDFVAKKFGGSTGNDPDWFKLQIKRYYGGTLQNDSVEVYLADYRYANNSQDYILSTWTWINLSSLGNVDSLAFFLSSSDNGSFGMNTPAFVCIDNLTTNAPVGIEDPIIKNPISLYPNPAKENFEIAYETESPSFVNLKMTDVTGRELHAQNFRSLAGLNKFKVETDHLPAGVYYVTMNVDGKVFSEKLIKQ